MNEEPTHRLDCVHSYNSKSRFDYTMPCRILKEMPGGRLKILVFGERWDGNTSKSRVRYVYAYKVHKIEGAEKVNGC